MAATSVVYSSTDIQVPKGSRVFELLSYLSKTQKNTEILGDDSPNPGTLFFEVSLIHNLRNIRATKRDGPCLQSFFNGQRIETDVLVDTLSEQDSCLVLMRKKTRRPNGMYTHSQC